MTSQSPAGAPNVDAGRPDLLAAILAATQQSVSVAQRRRPLTVLERAAAARTPRGAAFRDALVSTTRLPVIAECKRRSPSRGVLRADYRPADIAMAYERAGAAAVSVLTEPAFFDGALSDLEAVRDAVSIPILRKDFIVAEYQLVEARAAGADAVLLIVAALDDAPLAHLLQVATSNGLAALVEVHDAAELTRALAAGADLVGVNNRNLRTLDVDLAASFSVIGGVPTGSVAVAESGIRTGGDLEALRRAGYDAFLVGESLMSEVHPGIALEELLRAGGSVPRGRR
jgi:indole-3-glycerol phosphate synthase